MEEKKLNDLDNKLLAICMDRPHSVNQLSKLLNISPASVSIKVKKLEDMKVVEVGERKQGKKTLIKTVKKGATKKYMIEILKKIKDSGGYISFKEFSTTPELYMGCEDYMEKSHANIAVLYSNNMVRRKVEITYEGLKFLKENSK